uniref:Bestrophin homolog n=1 Tax=Romanomermis culicivorax TaxID=13658 RepID=A0A915HUD5_ROMCU
MMELSGIVGADARMTIRYEGSFLWAIFRWRGSVWKAIWRDLMIWLLIYYSVRLGIDYLLSHNQRAFVRDLIQMFDSYTNRIPLEFLLGFYVSQTVTRWWNQVHELKSPQDLMSTIVSYIHDLDDDSVRIRHTVARYLLMANTLAFRNISSRIQEVYPHNQAFVEVGLMTEEERQILEKVPSPVAYELPFLWANELVRSKVGNQMKILSGFSHLRRAIASLMRYNSFSLPLVYTQTVTVAVYGYFLFCLIGHQFTAQPNTVDTVVPFLTIFRFMFGVGWLKPTCLAELMVGPELADDGMWSKFQKYKQVKNA